jgi:hypothetical protein
VLSYGGIELSLCVHLRWKELLGSPECLPVVIAGMFRHVEQLLLTPDVFTIVAAVNCIVRVLLTDSELIDDAVEEDGVRILLSALRTTVSSRVSVGNDDIVDESDSEVTVSLPDLLAASPDQLRAFLLKGTRDVSKPKPSDVVVGILAHMVQSARLGERVCAQVVRYEGCLPLVQALERCIAERSWKVARVARAIVTRLFQHSVESQRALLGAGALPALFSLLRNARDDTFFFAITSDLVKIFMKHPSHAMNEALGQSAPEVVRTLFDVLDFVDEHTIATGRKEGVQAAVTCLLALISSSLPLICRSSQYADVLGQLRGYPGGLDLLVDGIRKFAADAQSVTGFSNMFLLYFDDAEHQLSSRHTFLRAGGIPAVLSALRKHGEADKYAATSLCALLRRASCTCCPLYLTQLAAGGTTAKLLRRLQNRWRIKHQPAFQVAGELRALLQEE